MRSDSRILLTWIKIPLFTFTWVDPILGRMITMVCPGKINTPISLSALNAQGERHNAMDRNQETGMPAEDCAQRIVRAARKNRPEVFIGKKEIIAVYLKRYVPWLFRRIIREQKAMWREKFLP